MATKNDIRKNIKVLKSEFEPGMIDFAGDIISYKIMALPEYKSAECIFVYVDYNREVKTSTLINDALKVGICNTRPGQNRIRGVWFAPLITLVLICIAVWLIAR